MSVQTQSRQQQRIEDDYELPNQPVWHKEQLVKFDDIRDRQERNGQSSNTSDDDQGLTMAEAVESWENSLKFSGSTHDQMRAVYQLVAHSSSTSNQPTGAGVDKSSPSFNPATHHFSPDELKPTPIQRKSRKTLVRVEDKDDKYWDKRRKNNMAAKRSREARRSRENQISLRASYLEKDNATLKEELLNVKEELQSLRETLLIAQQQNERMSHQQQQQQRHMKQPMRSHQQSNGVMLNNNWAVNNAPTQKLRKKRESRIANTCHIYI